MYLDAKGNVIPMASLYDYKAVAVPGTVMGLQKILDEYGTMKRAQVMAPAIKLAAAGICPAGRRSGLLPGEYRVFQEKNPMSPPSS